MNLQNELDAFRSDWEARVGDTIATRIADDIEALRATGMAGRVVRVGARLPRHSGLRDAHGEPFDLASVVGRKPVVLVFYRGGWCPYCNLELRAYQQRLSDIRAYGAELIAISPEAPDASLDTAGKNALAFAVLSDEGNRFADALGLRFTLTPELRPLYEAAGHALPGRNGDDSWTLPLPATLVVDHEGVVVLIDVDPDYRRRLEPQRVIDALCALSSGVRGALPV
jgi:peroxiredoxin